MVPEPVWATEVLLYVKGVSRKIEVIKVHSSHKVSRNYKLYVRKGVRHYHFCEIFTIIIPVVGWLVILREREREREREIIDEWKTCQSITDPRPTKIRICRTSRYWKFTKHHRTTRPPPIIPVSFYFSLSILIILSRICEKEDTILIYIPASPLHSVKDIFYGKTAIKQLSAS